MYLKDQTEKRSLKQLKIWTLKRTGARKGNWDVAISEIGVNLEGYKILEAEKRKYLSRRKWWLTKSSAMEELNYMRTKNYLGIMTLRRVISVDGDKRLTDKDWIKTGDLVSPILGYILRTYFYFEQIIFVQIFVLPEAFYNNKQLKTINPYKWKTSKISHVYPFNGILPSC